MCVPMLNQVLCPKCGVCCATFHSVEAFCDNVFCSKLLYYLGDVTFDSYLHCCRVLLCDIPALMVGDVINVSCIVALVTMCG